jgi:uncharacterized membrane protein (DUF485 family)
MAKLKKEDILSDPDFINLSKQKITISIILTILELVLYFGFIGLIAFNKPFLAEKLSSCVATTIGIPIAVGTINGHPVVGNEAFLRQNFESSVPRCKGK